MNKKSQSAIVFAIFSIGFIAQIIGAITPAIQAIGNAFPDVPFTSLMLVSTLPSLIAVPFSIIGGAITGKALKYKTVTYISMLLIAIGGMAPYWIKDWTMILAARALFGVGMGLMMPLGGALIFNLVAPEKQANIMGLNGVIGNVGGMVITLLGGVLATMHWSLPFLIHGITLIILIIVAIFLPEPQKPEIPADAPAAGAPKASGGMPAPVWIWSLVMLISTVLFYPSLTNISTIFQEMGLNPAMAGTAIILMTIGGMVTGLFFGKIFGAMSFKCIPLGFIIIGCSQLLMAIGSNFVMFAGAEALLGIGNTFVMTAIMMAVGGAVTPDRSPMAMSFMMAGMNIGGFLSAFIYAAVMGAMGISTMRFQYWSGLICYGIMTVVSFLALSRKPAAPPPQVNA